MFTGLVECQGIVTKVERHGESSLISIQIPFAHEVKIGESVAVDGCCLTAIAITGSEVSFQVGFETLRRTTFDELRKGSYVNLERALHAQARLGGHFVQGHVDSVGIIEKKIARDDWAEVWFHIGTWTEQLVPKGSVAVDGISLTVVEVTETSFSVMLVPHTLSVTSLGTKVTGDRVNIETDILGKYVYKMIQKMLPGKHSID